MMRLKTKRFEKEEKGERKGEEKKKESSNLPGNCTQDKVKILVIRETHATEDGGTL